jgi:hypothetical protein
MKTNPVQIDAIKENEIIFAISLENNGIAYMTCRRTNYLNEERAIVILDTKKFQELWRADPNPLTPELSNGTCARWVKDSKYPDAENGFKQGKENPVPLAKIAFYGLKNSNSYIDFTNGITRSIWLLAHGATAFPVECHVAEAEALSISAGFEPGKYLILANVLKL